MGVMVLKGLSVYEIRDMALKSGRSVFSPQQLSNLIGRPKPVATVYMNRLVARGLASRLMRGRIAFDADDFVIATQLVEPSYVSLDSALLFHGIIKQVTRNVECATTINSIVYGRLGIEYHKIPARLFLGYERHSRGASYTFVATPEKALVDGLYLGMYSEERFAELARGLDLAGMARMLERFDGKGAARLKRVIGSLA